MWSPGGLRPVVVCLVATWLTAARLLSQMNSHVTSFQRHFVGDVKRCDEMERKIRFLQEQLDKEAEIDKAVVAGVPPIAQGAPSITLDQLESRLEVEEREL